ncbi:hypothetical protein DVH24_019759 [Malus domestica]|uniref:Uncharacterized protein n=1 Tax=Malus domestica TaxID=3750 RepID=A0A498I5V8_MALDO|nr:hypothetical protein DVH24_019759 [Malus domestica]
MRFNSRVVLCYISEVGLRGISCSRSGNIVVEPFQELSVRVCVAVREWRKQEYGFKRSNVGVAERERNCKRRYK